MEKNDVPVHENKTETISDHTVLQMELMELKNHLVVVISRMINLIQTMENKALK